MIDDHLAQFLKSAAGRDFRLGEWDCGLWLADWYVAATGGPDPAALVRGAGCYHSEDLVQMVRRITRLAKVPRTAEPQRGDIALIRLQRSRAFGAICSGPRWILLADERGLSSVPIAAAKVIAAWKVPDTHCPRAPIPAHRSIR